ncbi:MAG: beta-propeller fold lactonase family protein [Acidobacteriota bacterium]|nr:beta-propeller fold lactonase family protein [Acidobacteriota bacterium]
MKKHTLGLCLFIGLGLLAAPSLPAEDGAGAVYTLSNQPGGNRVVAFRRDPGGSLTPMGTYPTGGAGMGSGVDPLGSQGAVVLDGGGRLLFAVNAGSDSVSTFAADEDGLELLNVAPSGGAMPVSVTVHGDVVYVLNAGGTPNVAGFTIDRRSNQLVPLPGSQRALSGGAAAKPAEVAFTPDGSVLLVTEKGAQTIDSYLVGSHGYLTGPVANHSSGPVPFGFDFAHRGIVAVSEAGDSALSTYRVGDDGQLQPISGSVPNGQTAVCWAVVTNDGRFAYTINAATASVSSYRIAPDGTAALLEPVAASAGVGSAPTDAALSPDSRYLFVRAGAAGRIESFRVGEDGSLTPAGSIGGIPAGSQGMAAR